MDIVKFGFEGFPRQVGTDAASLPLLVEVEMGISVSIELL